jgi:hypothetical protein
MSRCTLCKGRNTCQFKYIKIEGQVYKRDTGNIFDDECDLKGINCHGCGVLYGNTHHIECDDERCPKDGRQLLNCGHLIGVKFHRGLTDNKGINPNVPINLATAEKLRHSPGEVQFRYDHWLKHCISSYLEYEDGHKLKNDSEYKHCLMVLRNVLDRMTGEEGNVMLSNEQVFCIWLLLEGHVYTEIQPRVAAKYLKIIDKNWRPRHRRVK